jgi:hypothetical protein
MNQAAQPKARAVTRLEAHAPEPSRPSRRVTPLSLLRSAVGNRGLQRALAPMARRDLPLQRQCACGGGGGDCHCDAEHWPLPRRPASGITINEPGDAYEREADRTAELVMRLPRATDRTGVQQCSPAIAAYVQRQSATPAVAGQTAGPSLEHRLSGASASGFPLAPGVRESMEARFGVDFAPVRVHTGPEAARLSADLDAIAFTHGRDIYFAPGAYSPATHSGQRLLAHELAHVLQQGGGRAGRRIQRFTTTEHTEIGNLAYQLARQDMKAVGPDSPLRSLLIQGSRFRWGEKVKTYGDVVADADFFDTLGDYMTGRGERATGLMGTIDVGRLATRNLPHFTPHNIRRWKALHAWAIDRMVFAHDQLQYATDLLHDIDPLLQRARAAILAGEDERAERLLGAYRVRFERVRPRIERIIPAARKLAWEALLQNGFAEHYLTDAFSAGHLITPRNEILQEEGIGPEEHPPSRAQAVRGALFPTWSELRELRAQARSLAWHDLDNYYGVEVRAADPGFGPWMACGDSCSERTANSHWHATRAAAIRADEESIKDLWRAGLNGERPADFSAVLDLLPRPTWRNYPGWGASEWRNQLKYIRGESTPHAPGTQLPDIVTGVLWPVEHCVELEPWCWNRFVGTSRDWVERWSYGAWVQPWINKVKASAGTRYDYAGM